MAVTVAKVTTAPMESSLRMLGTTTARQRVTVRAPAAGRLSGLHVGLGDQVRRGAKIASITTREEEAVRLGLALDRQLDPQNADGMAGAIRRRISSTGIPVRATDSGIVSQRFVADGQLVADMDQIIELIDPSSIYVEAAAPIGAAQQIHVGSQAGVTSPLTPGAPLPARVAAISPTFNQNGATVPVRLEFTSDKRIEEAGATVEAKIVIASDPDATVIPAQALFQDAEHGGFYVFVLGTDSRAHRTPVELGIQGDAIVQVKSGVAPGQSVITSGGYALSDGLKVRATVQTAPDSNG
jgi:RND family efflux transporter MFP subunit